MISINDVDCEYLFNMNDDGYVLTGLAKQRWNDMSEEERSQYVTTKLHSIHVDARETLDYVYAKIVSDYGDIVLYEQLQEDTTDDFVMRFQKMLDEIAGFSAARWLELCDEIDPTIDLKEV